MTVDIARRPQQLSALQTANKIRQLRAQDCRKIRQRGGEQHAARLLDDLPDHWKPSRTTSGGASHGSTSTVGWFLLHVWGYGPARVRELLDTVMYDLGSRKQISGARQLADLTVRERIAIAARLRAVDSTRRERADGMSRKTVVW